MLEFKANSTYGIFISQSCWSARIALRNICPIDLLARSVAPSVCGWNDVDISNFDPNNLCNSRHQTEVNLGSLSDTIESGSPCNHTISCIYFNDRSVAVSLVLQGIRCT